MLASADAAAIPAGTVTVWLAETEAALRGERDADVPCDGCTACCTSAQFVHIGPDEIDALERIPGQLLFPAPRAPAGHVVMGYDERGHCPMLVDGACSIYEHRPRACRTYDCRVFAATGLEPDGERQVAITDRVRRWRFDATTAEDRAVRDALHAAASHLRDHPVDAPDGFGTATTTQLAAAAVVRVSAARHAG